MEGRKRVTGPCKVNDKRQQNKGKEIEMTETSSMESQDSNDSEEDSLLRLTRLKEIAEGLRTKLLWMGKSMVRLEVEMHHQNLNYNI